jgi:hypothetical protein
MAITNPNSEVPQRSGEPHPAASPKPGLMEILHNNIVIVAVVVAIAAGTTIFGVTSYYYEQQKRELEATHALQLKQIDLQNTSDIHKLRSRISSIDRRLGDQKYLDIQTFFKDKPQSTTRDSIYISDAEIIAPDYSDRWMYTKTTEEALIKAITGADLSDDKKVGELLRKLPVHQWRGRDEFNLAGVPIKKLFPSITVQVMPLSFLQELSGKLTKLGGARVDQDLSEQVTVPSTDSLGVDQKSPEKVHEHDKNNDEAHVRNNDKDMEADAQHFVTSFQYDLTGSFFVSQLMNLQNMSSDPHVTFSLRNIQKVGPVLYAQVIVKFEDVVVNTTWKPKLFLVREYYLISKESNLIILETNALSEIPSFVGEYFDDINQWLGGFYLAEK